MAPVTTIRVNGCIMALYKSELLNPAATSISELLSSLTGSG